jgi:hypothetical protein
MGQTQKKETSFPNPGAPFDPEGIVPGADVDPMKKQKLPGKGTEVENPKERFPGKDERLTK